MTTRTHVYIDLDVVNNNFRSEATAPVLRFEETRNSPYLDGDSADYYCSIIRFSIQTGNSLPVFIPRIETGQTDVTKKLFIMYQWNSLLEAQQDCNQCLTQ